MPTLVLLWLVVSVLWHALALRGSAYLTLLDRLTYVEATDKKRQKWLRVLFGACYIGYSSLGAAALMGSVAAMAFTLAQDADPSSWLYAGIGVVNLIITGLLIKGAELGFIRKPRPCSSINYLRRWALG